MHPGGTIEMVSAELRNLSFAEVIERFEDYDFYDFLDNTIKAIFDPWPKSTEMDRQRDFAEAFTEYMRS